MVLVNCKHADGFGFCKKKKRLFGLFKRHCCEYATPFLSCSIAERYPRPKVPPNPCCPKAIFISPRRNEIVMLIGNIGTGKSTIARKFMEKGNVNYVIISADGIRYAIGGGIYLYNHKYESVVWETVGLMLDGFMEKGINIIIDASNLTVRGRKKNFSIIKKYDNYRVIGLVMPDLDMEVAVNRRMKNPHNNPDKNLWEEVWNRFDSSYKEPTKEEGFDELIYLV